MPCARPRSWLSCIVAGGRWDGGITEVFIDVFDIGQGGEIAARNQTELSACDELVALLTPWSCERNWVWTEIGGAWSRGKHVVGVLYGLTLRELENDRGGARPAFVLRI